ncbi:DNA recombination protein RmuC [Caulobacter sp. KR2-114]|uniref:DNA recombination protein RmuC n=1 Tax=Caulobacter sp. KR2-114 TaxID=3400912 RepID=UPI003C08CBD0
MANLGPFILSGVIGLLAAAMVALVLVVVLRRHGLRPAGASEPMAERVSLERELAVARERLSQATQHEQELASARSRIDEERAAKVQAQTELAAALATGSEREATTADLKGRLQGVEAARKAEAEAARDAREASDREVSRLKVELAGLKEALDQERRNAEEKLKLLSEARDAMTKEFQVMANDVMSRHGETFTKQNKEQLDGLLTPLRDKLKEFQDGLASAQTDSAKERAALSEQVRLLSEQSAKMTTETVNLTRALKGKSQTQGAWGEMILASLLEKSGLREGEEYISQFSQTLDDGRRLRPDVIVRLPNGQQVVIDAKVSLVAFETYVNSEDEAERDVALSAHLASMRKHIKHLASKDYQALAGDHLDYVIMFVPIEGALAAALQKDPTLTTFAVQNNVAIATPTTLMIALRTVDNVWQVERRNRNAEAIAERAGHLYNKFVGFVEDLQKVGQKLDQAQLSYRGAMTKLQTGHGNLVGQAQKLRELGARNTKALPKGLYAEDEGDDEGDEAPTLPSLEPARLIDEAAAEIAH